MFTRDVFAFYTYVPPLYSHSGHGEAKSESYTKLFTRVYQAMQMETTNNALGWLGAVLHDTEDTGAPPHAAFDLAGSRHPAMETWVDSKKIDITGYKANLLGKTLEQALVGYNQRMSDLHDYSLERAKKIIPLVDAKDRPAAEVLILECALEAARATADTLHTLGYLQSQMKPIPGTGVLSGDIKATKPGENFTAKIMMQDTVYSTLSDLNGHYEFRNLPVGKYQLVVMMPGAKPAFLETTVEADKTTTLDIPLVNDGNLLRNGGFSVRWAQKDIPDGWYKKARNKESEWWSERFLAHAGQSYRVTIDWKEGAEGEAVINWDRNGNDPQTLAAGTGSKVFSVPQDGKGLQSSLIIRCKGNPWDVVKSVSISLEPAMPASK
jgi:hypothetical protein